MKYLTDELFIKCFCCKTYDENEDKFLIGYKNNSGNKLKDVITGQVIECPLGLPIAELKCDKADFAEKLVRFLVSYGESKVTINKIMLAKRIASVLSKDVVEESQIIKIKNIMNREIVNNREKLTKKNERLNKEQKELEDKYSVKETERDF